MIHLLSLSHVDHKPFSFLYLIPLLYLYYFYIGLPSDLPCPPLLLYYFPQSKGTYIMGQTLTLTWSSSLGLAVWQRMASFIKVSDRCLVLAHN